MERHRQPYVVSAPAGNSASSAGTQLQIGGPDRERDPWDRPPLLALGQGGESWDTPPPPALVDAAELHGLVEAAPRWGLPAGTQLESQLTTGAAGEGRMPLPGEDGYEVWL